MITIHNFNFILISTWVVYFVISSFQPDWPIQVDLWTGCEHDRQALSHWQGQSANHRDFLWLFRLHIQDLWEHNELQRSKRDAASLWNFIRWQTLEKGDLYAQFELLFRTICFVISVLSFEFFLASSDKTPQNYSTFRNTQIVYERNRDPLISKALAFPKWETSNSSFPLTSQSFKLVGSNGKLVLHAFVLLSSSEDNLVWLNQIKSRH